MEKQRKKQKVDVLFIFTEGWKERFTQAAYELWKQQQKGVHIE